MMSCIEGTYRLGTFLKIMLEKISPSKVIVYGAMQKIFLMENQIDVILRQLEKDGQEVGNPNFLLGFLAFHL